MRSRLRQRCKGVQLKDQKKKVSGLVSPSPTFEMSSGGVEW